MSERLLGSAQNFTAAVYVFWEFDLFWINTNTKLKPIISHKKHYFKKRTITLITAEEAVLIKWREGCIIYFHIKAQSQTAPYTLPLHTTPPFARRVRHIKCCSKPTSVEGDWAIKPSNRQRVCIGADLRPVTTQGRTGHRDVRDESQWAGRTRSDQSLAPPPSTIY